MGKETESHLHSQWSIDVDPGFKSGELTFRDCYPTLYPYTHIEGQTDAALLCFLIL